VLSFLLAKSMWTKLLVIFFCALCAGMFAASAAYGQLESAAKFRTEILPSADGGPKFTVTNLSDNTLTACVIRFSVSSQAKPESHMDWDAIVQGGRNTRRGSQQPLEPQASLTMSLPHVVGDPLPDKVEVVAGVWADGTTFGEADWLKVILGNRAYFASSYEQAISFLKSGLDQKWTRDQYLEALSKEPKSGPFYAIRRTLEANRNASRILERIIQHLLKYFTENLTLLRQAKPAVGVTSGQAQFRVVLTV
jgi:hypothetical protein